MVCRSNTLVHFYKFENNDSVSLVDTVVGNEQRRFGWSLLVAEDYIAVGEPFQLGQVNLGGASL